MLRGDRVKIKPRETICEYVHNLKGTVIKVKTESIWKRINGDPKRIGKKIVYIVDLSENIDPGPGIDPNEWEKSSKEFRFDEQDLELI